jgi:hypothetical protein
LDRPDERSAEPVARSTSYLIKHCRPPGPN